MITHINKIIYIILGSAITIISSIALFDASGYAPVPNDEVYHIMREAGSAGIFVGLSMFWCVFNYTKSRGIHYLLMLFFLCFSVLHWWDYINDLRTLHSGLINSLPFLLLSLRFLDKSDHPI